MTHTGGGSGNLTRMRFHNNTDLRSAYLGFALDAPLSRDDIAYLAGVTSDQVYRWATGMRGPGGFPAPFTLDVDGRDVEAWHYGPVVDWLCGNGRLSVGCAAPDEELWAREDIAAYTGLRVSSIRTYAKTGELPPADVRLEPHRRPRWKRETIEAWWASRVDHRRKVPTCR